MNAFGCPQLGDWDHEGHLDGCGRYFPVNGNNLG